MIKFNDLNFEAISSNATYQTLIKRKFYNRYSTKQEFHIELKHFNFNDKELVRPSFDLYFMRLTELAASRSNCMKRGNGAIITKDNRIISTGYNGTAFGLVNCNEGGCQRCNENVK